MPGVFSIAFSAALCRGLIEAHCHVIAPPYSPEFSAALCRGLIEALNYRRFVNEWLAVFRGFMSRPH